MGVERPTRVQISPPPLMQIVSITKNYFDLLVHDFARIYSEKKGRRFTIATSNDYLRRSLTNFPDWCFAVVNDEGVCLGGVFCRLDPNYEGQYLFVDSLQVFEPYKRQGVAKLIFQTLVSLVKKKRIHGIHFLIDDRQVFPKSWYKKMGFRPSGWVDYEIELHKIKL